MSENVNRAFLLGRVYFGPKTRLTKAGVTQTVFGLETTESWVDKQTGERREKQNRFTVVVYGAFAAIIAKRLRKGVRVFCEGAIEIRRWMTKDKTPTENWTVEILVTDRIGQVTVLDSWGVDQVDDAPADVDDVPADVSDAPADAPVPLSIKRSHAKYGDLDAAPDAELDRGLRTFLGESDDHARRVRREAGDERRST